MNLSILSIEIYVLLFVVTDLRCVYDNTDPILWSYFQKP